MKKVQVLLAALSAVMVSSCGSHRSLFLVHIVDVSASAREESFSKVSEKICHSVISAAREKDLYSHITVDAGLSPAADPLKVSSRDRMHADCKKVPESNSEAAGTFPCKAWERALGLVSKRVDTAEYIPVVVSRVQANELEKEEACADVIKSLAKTVGAQQGKILIAGSTNQGATRYNDQLWETLSENPRVQFVSGDVAQSIENEIKTIRKGDQ